MIKLKDILLKEVSVSNTDRIHVAENEIQALPSAIKQSIGYKPVGLWYAFGRGWIEFLYDELSEPMGDFVYKIEVANCNLLKLTNEQEIHDFTKKYTNRDRTLELIDWFEVSKLYDGVEFNPYIRKLRYVYQSDVSYTWYYAIDIPSGCIWNTNKCKYTLISDRGI